MINNDSNISKGNFEGNLIRLKEVVKQLEEGNLTLEESLKYFEEGIKLYRSCNSALNDAQQKISILLEEDNSIKEKPFIVTEED